MRTVLPISCFAIDKLTEHNMFLVNLNDYENQSEEIIQHSFKDKMSCIETFCTLFICEKSS